MENNHHTNVIKDLKEKSILVSREFNAPLELVWRAHTESQFLDQWWGPSPWRAETKTMNFIVGGYWLYVMIGPQNEKHWGRMNYLEINKHNYFRIEDVFCDENGIVNSNLPASEGTNVFTKTSKGTLVEFKMTYSNEKDLQKIIEMGFEQGISICYNQLENILKDRF